HSPVARPGHHHPRARAIDTTAVEVPRTWAAPAARAPARRPDHDPRFDLDPRPGLDPRRGLDLPGPGFGDPVPPPGPGPAVPHPGRPPHPREHGERGRFLALARQGLSGGALPFGPAGPVGPAAPRPAAPDRPPAPRPTYPGVQPDDLAGSFARAVEAAGGVCHRVTGRIPDLLLDHLVAELDAWDVVVTADPEARALGERLTDRGVQVTPAGRAAAGQAVVGVTVAVAGIAATGAVVLGSDDGDHGAPRRPGDEGRHVGAPLAATLPPVHLCVVPVERLVATPADVLRPLGTGPGDVPAALSLVTGPARRGDIEQLLTAGVPGPGGLHVIVVEGGPEGPGAG
ncbi:MAG TPA: LUD domain-containing protein, partial [Acidimicrobiales bacterium]